MLDTKYIIYNPEAAPIKNSGALGNVWFVSSDKFVGNADEEIGETGRALFAFLDQEENASKTR